MGPEPETWDDYLQPDPRERSHQLPLLPSGESREEIRAKITHQEHIVGVLEAALDAARKRLAQLHKRHTEMILADSVEGSGGDTKM
jgi:hypothetical protein